MYEQYERRMQRIAAFFRKHRITFLIGFIVILAALFVIFGVGITVSKTSCGSITYGDKPDPEAKTTALRVEYEYRPITGMDWSKEVPTEAGTYEVRGFSVSFCGIRRNLGTAEFKIKKKNVTVTFADKDIFEETSSAVFDGSDLRADGLVNGDRLSGNFTHTEEDADGVLKVYPEYAEIVHEDGSGANDCYNITYEAGSIRDARIWLELKTGTKTVKYSGNPSEDVSSDTVTISQGKLRPGHKADFHCITVQSGFGRSDNEIDPATLKITDEDGNDVTGQYIIYVNKGLLAFDKRVITISSDSAEKDYDGTPLSKNSFTIRGDGLADGDRLVAECISSRTDPGISDNVFEEYAIVSDTYGDVTDCYEVTVKLGKLKVNYPEDGEIDGSDSEEFDLDHAGGLRSGNPSSGKKTILFSFRGQSRRRYYFRENNYMNYDGHTWKNPAGGVAYEPEAEYLTGFALYDNGYQKDRVLIRKRRLSKRIYPYFMSGKEYESDEDYYEYACDTFTLGLDDSFEYPYYTDYVFMGEYENYVREYYMDVPSDVKAVLLELGKQAGIRQGSSTMIRDIAKFISTAATYDLDHPAFPSDEDLVIWFLTQSKSGICQHYASAATLMYRAYGIPARFVVGYVAEGKAGQWVDVDIDTGHAWVEIFLEGTGWVPVEVTGGGGGQDGAGGISGGYVDDGGGGFGFDRADLLIAFEAYSKDYDGQPVRLENPGWYIEQGMLKEGDEVYVPNIVIYAPPEVGTYREDVDIRILDKNGQDVTYEYSFGYSLPYVEITQRKIEISTYGMTVTEGEGPAQNNRWFISKGTLASGDSVDIVITASQEDVGRRQNWPDSVHIYNDKNEDVTEMYSISYNPGVLEVTAAKEEKKDK